MFKNWNGPKIFELKPAFGFDFELGRNSGSPNLSPRPNEPKTFCAYGRAQCLLFLLSLIRYWFKACELGLNLSLGFLGQLAHVVRAYVWTWAFKLGSRPVSALIIDGKQDT